VRAASVLLLLVGIAVLVRLAIDRHYYPDAPEFDAAPPADLLDARRQDLEYFRHYLELDRSYTDATRREAEAIVAEVASRVAGYSNAGFQLAIARAVAAADNGHSNVWLGRFSREHGRLPLRLYWFSDGVFVVRTRPDLEALLGAELLAVGGVPLEQAAEALGAFAGGTDEAFRAYRGPSLLELPAAHAAAGLSESELASALTFRLADGTTATQELAAESLAESTPLYRPSVYLLAAPPELRDPPWVGLASLLETLPDYLQEPRQPFRMRVLPAGGLYLQYRDNFSDGIDVFERDVREAARRRPPDYIVVDQRFNGGGDYTLTAGLMSDLPGLVAAQGRVYVLTGPTTFSAGINSVAFVKAAGGERVTIVGERIGDRERAWGETNDFELPHSRLGMTFNTGLHDVENGCPPFPECYFLNYFHDVAVGKLDPDIPVGTTSADYLAGVDPVLEAVLGLEGESGEP
jgi:hypothetical protein